MKSDRTAREELLALHRKIWQENKRRIDRSARDDTGELARYRGAYTRACSTYRSVTSFPQMVNAARRADTVYVGDYHTSKQSQKVFLKLVQRLWESHQARPGKQLVIALELLQSKHQAAVDRYLQGSLPEAAFLNAVKFHKHWPFDNWENFRPIFDFARQTGTPVIGIDAKIDGSNSLSLRDEHAADILARARAANPGAAIVVLIGDLHIAPSHLPAALDRALARRKLPKTRPLLVFQNSESVYWKLAGRELERSAEVVRLTDRAFCVMNTPPIILQQTYLNWLERESEVLDYADARAEFMTLLKRIAQFLDIELGPDADEVEVYTCGDLSFLHRLRTNRLFRDDEIEEIKRQIRSAESYMIPRSKMVYLANLSTNHAAEEASHFLKILCAPEELPRERVAAFYANALHEAIGFFGSKIINDRRKTPHERQFERLLKSKEGYGPGHRRIARLVLEHKALERRLLADSTRLAEAASGGDRTGTAAVHLARELAGIWKQPVDVFIGVTHALGYMLGEKLFYGMVAGTVPKSTMRDLYYDPFTAPGRARIRYFELVETVKNVKVPVRT